MRQDRYNVGWNDLAHGILTWTDGCSTGYATLEEYAKGIRSVATDCQALAQKEGRDGGGYYAGTIDAANQFLNTGCIERKLVL